MSEIEAEVLERLPYTMADSIPDTHKETLLRRFHLGGWRRLFWFLQFWYLVVNLRYIVRKFCVALRLSTRLEVVPWQSSSTR